MVILTGGRFSSKRNSSWPDDVKKGVIEICPSTRERECMSTRERWIVYPLLFLTMGIAMRDQFLPTRSLGAVDFRAGKISAQEIVCDKLVVQQEARSKQLLSEGIQANVVKAGAVDSVQSKSIESGVCRTLFVKNEKGKPVVMLVEDQATKSGAIQTMNANGMPLVQIRPSDVGGLVSTIGHDGKVLVAMGHQGQKLRRLRAVPAESARRSR